MPRTIVFDVNETLLDVEALAPHFTRLFGDARALREWFSLLLLYSEASTLAGPYRDFSELAGAVLEMFAAGRLVPLQARDKQQVLEQMRALPPHPEVRESLQLLKANGYRMVTLTNSGLQAVEHQMRQAGLADLIERNFSVEQAQRYKPSPEPYLRVAHELHVAPGQLRLVAAHPWDVLGAMRAGCAGAFVARPGKAWFPLAPPPDIHGRDLRDVAAQILEREARTAA